MKNHKEKAELLLSTHTKDSFLTPAQWANINATAQIHATLYLAEQQRIANLIAWYSARADDFAGAHGDEIREALGAR